MLNSKRLASATSRLVRMMSHVTAAEGASVPWKEIRIPVPWGHIAAKEWGSVGKRPILVIHGWQDNCGSFDKLIPLLPVSDLHIVVIDLPGHGLSSHKPPGMLYNSFDYVIDIRRVIRYLGWTRYSIMAHSLGAAVGVSYACTYPSEVEKFIALEQAAPDSSPVPDDRNVNGINQLFEQEERAQRPPPSYTREEAIKMIVNSMFLSYTEESAGVILIRGAREIEGGKLIFNRDPRVKIKFIPPVSMSQIRKLFENMRCEYMLINADKGLTRSPEFLEDLEIYKKGAKYFEVITVEGTHHVHLNNPERVAPHINRFLRCGTQ